MKVTGRVAQINLEPWRAKAEADTARRLVESLKYAGFAYISGHGVPQDVIRDVFDAARQFFSQDAGQLDAVHCRHSMNYRGWFPPGTNPVTHHEMYDLGMNVPAAYAGLGAELRTAPNLWPEDLRGFRPAAERYQAAMRDLADTVLSAIAAGLSLPADFFRVRCAEPHGHLRLLHYFPVPDAGDRAFSIGRHSDYETVTILAQERVGGLQVRTPAGTWIDMPPVDGTFIINVGDMLALWTNGLLPAGQHRVASPAASERYAVAFFYATGYDIVIEPALPPASPDGQAYEPVTTGDFMYWRFTEDGY